MQSVVTKLKSGQVDLTPAQQNGAMFKAPRQILNPDFGHNSGNTAEFDKKAGKLGRVQYQLKNVIGKGSFGVVYRAINRKTQQVVAIKEVNYENDEELNDIMSEIHLLKNLNHINIVKYHGYIQKMSSLYIILEYCDLGSLKKLISPNKGMDEKDAISYIQQTLLGLSYLHEQGVIHRDIKAANLLIDSTKTVKLADFGVSTKVNSASMALTLAGSLNWMAPEIITNRGASTLSDIWSLGATVVELLTGNPPFHNLVDVNIYYAIEHDTYFPPEKYVSPLASEFLTDCFQKNMYLRPSAKQLLQHPWLNGTKKVVDYTVSPTKKKQLDRLDKFKESSDDEQYTWDDDFRDKNVDVSPVKKVSSTPLPSTSSSSTNTERSHNNTKSSATSMFNGEFLLSKLRNGQMISNYSILFKECEPDSIAYTIISLMKNEDCDAVNHLVAALFSHDFNFNSSLMRSKFVSMGGLSYILDNEEIIMNSFYECTSKDMSVETLNKLLIQCGIMNERHFKNLTNNFLILNLVSEYLNCTSRKHWAYWCAENLNIFVFFQNGNIHDKMAQSILIKLSSSASWFGNKFLQPLTQNITAPILLSNQQTFYTVFKCIALIFSKKTFDANSTATSPNSSPINTIRSSSSKKASFEIKNLAINEEMQSDNNINTLIKVPVGFNEWLCSFLNNKSHKIELQYWKYYFKVCHKLVLTHQSSMLTLFHTREFFNWLTQMFKAHDDKQIAVIFQQATTICVDLSMHLRKNNVPPMLLNLAINMMQFEQYSNAGATITLNCLQLLLHDNSTLNQVSSEILSIDFEYKGTKTNTLLHNTSLLNPFFELNQKSASFGNFLNTFGKIVALHPLGYVCEAMVMHKKFYSRIINFLDIYKGSLLLQIDLLKFLKLVFTRALHSNFDNTQEIAKKVVMFLDQNWKFTKKSKSCFDVNSILVEQVGSDSILIQHLCSDIKELAYGLPMPFLGQESTSD